MTLRQKISWQVGATLAGLLLVSGMALVGIDALHQDYGVALEGYQRLRQAYVAGTHLQTAQKLLRWPHPQAVAAARAEVAAAATAFGPLERPGGGWDAAAASSVRVALRRIAVDLQSLERPAGGDLPSAEVVGAQRDAIVAQLGRIGDLSASIGRATEAAEAAAAAKRRATFAAVAVTSGLVVLAAVVLGVLHYRGVMGPVRRLGDGVRRLTAGQFQGRVDDRGRDELAGLARDFNRMADELDGFYAQLERKVAEKSRELVRSDRLASAGYLAAGVAHEINNPLSIISGYAEYAIAELEKPGRQTCDDRVDGHGIAGAEAANGQTVVDGRAAEVAKSLRVIRDEAFRCKAITGQLLSLARGQRDDDRQPVSMLTVAREVASIVGGLRDHRDKRVLVRAAGPVAPEAGGDGAGEWVVSAVEAEMKQVLLNLTVNALEAVPPGAGEVRIDLRRLPGPPLTTRGDDLGPIGGWVELAVTDNGRGMSAETAERAFEPFFTEKRGAREDGRHGTGLGLSVTHAIVRSHGGTITSHSDGPGRGSRFVVRLPAAQPVLHRVAEASS